MKTHRREMSLRIATGLAVVIGAIGVGSAWAQQAEQYGQKVNVPLVNVPASGVQLQTLPRLGEAIHDALISTVIKPDPIAAYIGNTRISTVRGLWESRAWYYRDGTGVEFYYHKYRDGKLELGSVEFSYRISGGPGDYHMCKKFGPTAVETCAKEKWEEGHTLYDEWYVDYDRPASGALPAYPNVHEALILAPAHQ